ncbi:hypothetical protein BWI17_03510 [Betaproteobacteria bacterium GR16-43]|nr:hypothetical protein BWI17_03510 [Betaproteobacteria bacterium GR16-43]
MAPLIHRVAALALVLATACVPARAQDGPITEESIKAAFLYKFPGFVDWPSPALERSDEPVVIGVYGSDDVGAELLSLSATRKGGRPLVVKSVRNTEGLKDTHVLFIGAKERSRAPEMIRAAQHAGVLTVTDWDGALRMGSVINFVTTPDGRVRFEISLEPAEKSRLRLSSRLLAVAQQVHSVRP